MVSHLPRKCAAFIVGGVALFLEGCGADSAPTEDKAESAIVLQCVGHGANREPISYLIKLHPGNQVQTSLHYYSSNEKRWTSPCEDNGFRCNFAVGKDLIEELGVKGDNPQATLQRVTVINRKTGRMSVQMISELPPITIFEGSCEKGTMPPEQDAKF